MRSFDLGDNVVLRHFQIKDADAIYSAVMENFDHLRPFLHWVVPEFSLATAKGFIRRSNAAIAEGTGETFGIFSDGQLAGTIGFVRFDKISRHTEIGYWVAKSFEGSGLITRSCRSLINYAFGELGMHRVEIRCAVENVRSRAVPERLDFKLEGTLRQSEWRHDRFYDMAVYGLLVNEWDRGE